MDKRSSDSLKQVPLVSIPMKSYPLEMRFPTDSQRQVEHPANMNFSGFRSQLPLVAISVKPEEAFNNTGYSTLTQVTQRCDAIGHMPPVENLATPTPIDPKKLKPATVVILNHEKFNDSTLHRAGSSMDVQSLDKTFKKLGCSIETINNPGLNEVTSTLLNLSKRDFKLQSALIIVILSHGSPKEKITASDNREYDLDTHVVHPLLENPSLKGKPLILVVQACKGVWEADSSVFRKDPLGIMKCYSTTEGFLSFRHGMTGSIYIQTFCEVMNKDALTKDFRAIVNDVNKQVITKSTENKNKQVPSITSTLYEPYCFGDFL
ncbi:caspase-3 [Drosophila bipectinata]|uniref:caspase-3 n=1 Tax=Drosophila bipectinata TaxID=42026 RepID=UPI0038B311BD